MRQAMHAPALTASAPKIVGGWKILYFSMPCAKATTAIRWNRWPRGEARRERESLESARNNLAAELATRRAIQFAFYEQWRALRSYCARRSIRVVGDIAIFVDYDSADVWAHRDLYLLKDDLEPSVVSGVPPDAFSATGQRWGNPLYDWEAAAPPDMRGGSNACVGRPRPATTSGWTTSAALNNSGRFLPASLRLYVAAGWMVPRTNCLTKFARRWAACHFLPRIWVTSRRKFTRCANAITLPGLAVLQFGFGNPGAHIYLPHRVTVDRVIYSGTHDNDTTLGWWNSNLSDYERRSVEAYIGQAAGWCELGAHPPSAGFGG